VTGVSKGPREFSSASALYGSATKAIITDIDEQLQYRVFQGNERFGIHALSIYISIQSTVAVSVFQISVSATPTLA